MSWCAGKQGKYISPVIDLRLSFNQVLSPSKQTMWWNDSICGIRRCTRLAVSIKIGQYLVVIHREALAVVTWCRSMTAPSISTVYWLHKASTLACHYDVHAIHPLSPGWSSYVIWSIYSTPQVHATDKNTFANQPEWYSPNKNEHCQRFYQLHPQPTSFQPIICALLFRVICPLSEEISFIL